jgi:hypothetical protein
LILISVNFEIEKTSTDNRCKQTSIFFLLFTLKKTHKNNCSHSSKLDKDGVGEIYAICKFTDNRDVTFLGVPGITGLKIFSLDAPIEWKAHFSSL